MASQYGQYSPPTFGGSSGSGGFWDAAGNFIKNNAGDILSTAGNIAEGVMSSQDRAKQLAEQKREYDANLAQRQAEAAQAGGQFGRTTGDTEAQAAVRAQTQLNTAPIADKAQALILARMGVSPGAFQPRDYTQGQASLTTPHAAPGANVATTMQNAAANYQPGQGGVDTSVLKALIAKMTGSSGLPSGTMGAGAPPTPPDGSHPPTGETVIPPVYPTTAPPPVVPSTSRPTGPGVTHPSQFDPLFPQDYLRRKQLSQQMSPTA